MYTILLLLIIYHVYISQKLFFSRSFISAFASSLVMVFTSVVTKSLISSVAMGAFVGSGR